MKKKWLPFGLILSASLFLGACNQPKEDPKDLALLAFDNLMKTEGVNIASSGDIKVDLSGAVGETDSEYDKMLYEEFKGFTYKLDGAVDLKNKKAEETLSVTVPFKSYKFNVDIGAQLDEKNNKLIIDADGALNTLDSLWTIVKGEELQEGLIDAYAEETIKAYEEIFAFLKDKLKNSYATYENEYISDDSIVSEFFDEFKDARKFLESIPADKFDYAKDKKGHYGHIVVKLSDKEVKELMKQGIEESYQINKDATEEEKAANEKWKKESLAEFEEQAKYMKFNKASISLVVDENKRPVLFDVDFNAKMTNLDDETKTVSYTATATIQFSNYNKPSFNMPVKGKKEITFKEIGNLLNQKIGELEEEYMEKHPEEYEFDEE